MKVPAWLRAHSQAIALSLAALVLVAAAAFVAVASRGSGPYDFGEREHRELDQDEAIRAWVSFDQPSYQRGDIVGYRFELLWRPDVVLPDLESFENNVSFYPFEKREANFSQDMPGDGLRRFTADFLLQPVDVAAPATYQLDTATMFYAAVGDEESATQAVRATPPPVHLGAFLPADVTAIEARPIKPPLDDAGVLRGAVLAFLGLALLCLGAFLLWQLARRRPYAELDVLEQLWREFHALRNEPARGRPYIVACEHIYTRGLEAHLGISPTAFWIGESPSGGLQQETLEAARDVFSAPYRRVEPDDEAIGRVESLLDAFLESAVDSTRMQREMQPGFVERLKAEPVLAGVSAAILAAAVALLMLATVPSAWLASDVHDYNAAVALADEQGELQAALDGFLALTESSEDARVRAAALYNAGTLLGDHRVAGLSTEQYANFRYAIAEPDVTLSRLMHSLELDAELELVALFTDLTRRYVQAEDMLEAAVRLDVDDQDARRNLELFTKIRSAIGRTLSQLVLQGETGEGSQEMLSQTVIDLRLLMESELPEEFSREDEGKDDRNYYILERF